jgi:hypothetical protein
MTFVFKEISGISILISTVRKGKVGPYRGARFRSDIRRSSFKIRSNVIFPYILTSPKVVTSFHVSLIKFYMYLLCFSYV